MADKQPPAELQAAEDAAEGIPPADLKIILLGDSAVGKSKLIERFLLDDYHPRQRSTFALTLYRHTVTVPTTGAGASSAQGGEGAESPAAAAPSAASSSSAAASTRVAVDFWDTAGQERFASMHPSYYYKAHACVLVFDVTRKVTYQNLQTWYKELRQYCEHIPCICIANKIDVDMRVTSKAFAFPQKYNLPFFFVSAADGTNVVKIFEEAVRLAWQYKHSGEKDFMTEVLDMLDDKALGAFGRALYGPGSPGSPASSTTGGKTAPRTGPGAAAAEDGDGAGAPGTSGSSSGSASASAGGRGGAPR